MRDVRSYYLIVLDLQTASKKKAHTTCMIFKQLVVIISAVFHLYNILPLGNKQHSALPPIEGTIFLFILLQAVATADKKSAWYHQRGKPRNNFWMSQSIVANSLVRTLRSLGDLTFQTPLDL